MLKNKETRYIVIFMIILALFGSLMIASAEMGNVQGETDSLLYAIIKQVVVVFLSYLCFVAFRTFRLLGRKTRDFYFVAVIFAFLLILPLAFPAAGGAHAWIRFSSFTIQPSEFAKCFIILLGAKLLGTDHKKDNKKMMLIYAAIVCVYVVIIAFLEDDLGSAVVLAGIAYGILLIPTYNGVRKIHNWLIIALILLILFIGFLMSPIFTEFCKQHSGNYMLGRFLSAANPFIDQYNTGYNLVLSLVSFATGGFRGLGYSNSIHKYMNFPNPSTDFILPVIVEETGIIGFSVILICYLGIMIILIKNSFKTEFDRSRIIYLGTFMYFALHFIFNVGGVSGLIPLTGVPLLMLSSGGSSTMAAMLALGICVAEIEFNIKKREQNESNKWQV